MSNGACAHLMGIHRGSEKPSLQVNVDRLDKREPDALPAYNGCGFMSATYAHIHHTRGLSRSVALVWEIKSVKLLSKIKI